MLVCTTRADTRNAVREWRRQGETLAFVPTMGFLHEGHLSLVREAALRCDRVAVSIFVNPTQFGPNEDLSTYPRALERDLELLEKEGVALVFTPDADEMYGHAGGTFVEVPELSGILQGALRPGHFRGVSTVVTKLFHIVQPDVAVFGEKDFQQLALIRQMVRDLDFPIEIVGHPTVRETDGLAMSSRNVRLTLAERAAAPVLNAALDAAEEQARREPGVTVEALEATVRAILSGCALGKVETVDLLDARSLQPATGPLRQAIVILLAVRFGQVLLIDQRVVEPGSASR